MNQPPIATTSSEFPARPVDNRDLSSEFIECVRENNIQGTSVCSEIVLAHVNRKISTKKKGAPITKYTSKRAGAVRTESDAMARRSETTIARRILFTGDVRGICKDHFEPKLVYVALGKVYFSCFSFAASLNGVFVKRV